MECSQCKAPLMISNSQYSSAKDSEDVHVNLTMVCVNPKCGNYCGTDLNKPRKVAATVRNKVN